LSHYDPLSPYIITYCGYKLTFRVNPPASPRRSLPTRRIVTPGTRVTADVGSLRSPEGAPKAGPCQRNVSAARPGAVAPPAPHCPGAVAPSAPTAPFATPLPLFTRYEHLFTRYRHQNPRKPDFYCPVRVISQIVTKRRGLPPHPGTRQQPRPPRPPHTHLPALPANTALTPDCPSPQPEPATVPRPEGPGGLNCVPPQDGAHQEANPAITDTYHVAPQTAPRGPDIELITRAHSGGKIVRAMARTTFRDLHQAGNKRPA
jgi:hypothetical protein